MKHTVVQRRGGDGPTSASLLSFHVLQEQLRIAFEDNPVGQILMDLSGDVLVVAQANRALESMLGFGAGEMAGMDALGFVHPDDWEPEGAIFERCLAGAVDQVAFRTRRRHRSGAWVPVFMTGRIVRDPVSGAPRYALASLVDITAELLVEEQREAALALAERRAELARGLSELAGLALAANGIGALLDATAQRVASTLNVDFCDIAQCQRDDHLRLIAGAGWDGARLGTVERHLGPETQAAYTLTCDKPVLVEDWDNEHRFRRSALLEAHDVRSGLSVAIRHGREWVGVIGAHTRSPRRFDSDEAAFLVAAAQLVGLAIARRLAATGLEQSELTLQMLVDKAPAAIDVLDAEGRFTLVNREFERMLGAAREAILGQTWDGLPATSADLAVRHGAADGRVLAGAPAHVFQEDVPADGGPRHYVSVDFPLGGPGRRLLGLGGISTDVTALKQAESGVQEAWRQTLRRIAIAVEYRDEETGAHVERMAALCGLIAAELGVDDQHRADITAAAALHDAGKIAVPDRILLKPGRLTDEERRVMETHCEVGYQLLSGSGSPLLDLAASIAWTHHERYDGTGYPRRLAGTDIPLEGRIAAVADVFDAMTNDRIYRPAIPVDETIATMRAQRSRQFDPGVLDALLAHLDDAVAIRDRFGAVHARQLEEARAAAEGSD